LKKSAEAFLPIPILRQYRTILIAQIRRQIFLKQTKLTRGIGDLLPRKFVRFDGKDASSCVIKAFAANCGVLP